jgi:hypothetical protein
MRIMNSSVKKYRSDNIKKSGASGDAAPVPIVAAPDSGRV